MDSLFASTCASNVAPVNVAAEAFSLPSTIVGFDTWVLKESAIPDSAGSAKRLNACAQNRYSRFGSNPVTVSWTFSARAPNASAGESERDRTGAATRFGGGVVELVGAAFAGGIRV